MANLHQVPAITSNYSEVCAADCGFEPEEYAKKTFHTIRSLATELMPLIEEAMHYELPRLSST